MARPNKKPLKMNTCKTCKWWDPVPGTIHGRCNHFLARGGLNSGKQGASFMRPYGEGGDIYITTGRDFGCVLWEYNPVLDDEKKIQQWLRENR